MTKPLLKLCRPDPQGGFYTLVDAISDLESQKQNLKNLFFLKKSYFLSYFPQYQVLYNCLETIDFECFEDF